MAKRSKRGLAKKIRTFVKTQARAQSLYAKSDELMEEIAALMENGDECKFSKDRKAIFTDNFLPRKKVWAHAAARPYELKLVNV